MFQNLLLSNGGYGHRSYYCCYRQIGRELPSKVENCDLCVQTITSAGLSTTLVLACTDGGSGLHSQAFWIAHRVLV